MGDLGPINEDVRFNHEAAENLISLCNTAASTIEGQTGSRAGWVTTAKQDFAGYFSELFASNQETAVRDSGEVSRGLRDVARFTGLLAEEARAEQQRREEAREWQREQDDRNALEKGWDWLTDGNDPPVPDMPEPSDFSPTVVPPTPRETPQPGSGGGSGSSGTSSARPSNLKTFANGSRGANSSLSGKPTSCRSAYDNFVAGCGWGGLNASDVFTSFTQLLEANQEDVRWADTVADAFDRAGSEGGVSTLSNSALSAALQSKGVDAGRDDIVVDPPSAYGSPPSSGFADDPVNAATGNFIEHEVDLSFAGGAASLSLGRTYNSFDTGTGAFGPGWSSWTEAGLALTDEAARLRLSDGRVVVFPREGDGWARGTGEAMWLDHLDERLLVAATNDGARWVFTADGRLVSHSRGPGTEVTLVRDDAGRLVRLEHERGRAIDLVWSDQIDHEAQIDQSARVVEARTSDDRTATYSYDAAGRLTGVTTATGTRTYHWDEAGPIVAVVDADGVVEVENTYDSVGRVTAQRSAHGRISRYVYLPGHVTVVSDPDGSRSNTWISDAKGRLVGVVDSDERRTSFAYDSFGNRVMVTDRDGSVTVREYDDRGRMTREVTPSGADLTYGHDELDRVTTVVTEAGAVTEYAYDAEGRNPSALVDPEGGRTEFTWADGLLTRVVDPTGVTVSMAYDEHGDLVSTTNADGDTARLERDAHGRVTAAVTPLGHRTTFTYAPTGLLASRRDPDGAVWHFEHTAAGRLAATVDPTGARTVIEHNEAGDAARTIDPLGRSITRHFDDLGNVASAELPDGTTWQFAHDAMSRLTATTTPDGAVWTREYDTTGELVGTTDPTGAHLNVTTDRDANTVTLDDGTAETSTRLDPLGRVVGGETADGSSVMATYDRCGRVVEQLDAEGGLTRIERDAAGKPVSVTTPGGVTTTYEYDSCGRLAAVVDGSGARTTRDYDADGRLVAVRMPTGEVATTDYDACGRVVGTRRPGRGVARYRYDAAGRVVETSDTWHGHRRFHYDDAGQLVAVVNGNGGITRYDYDANGRAVAITDPLGQVTRREFDAMNHCVAETDPLGRTTRAGYDGAGRISWQTDPDGHTTSWTYDEAGRLAGLTVDGRPVSTVERDIRGRRATITDHTRDSACSIELAWNRRGQLVSRSRDGQAVTWDYDADGRRTSLTTPDGTTTSYAYDSVGRLALVDHPLLGRATFTRDAAGRLVEASADGVLQTWEHQDGHVVAHTVGDADGFTRTAIRRDDLGRVVGITNQDGDTTYSYDEAQQLIEARTGGSVHHWRYDPAGRLVTETIDSLTVEHAYDAAGQLVASDDGSRRTAYSYDGAGRRVREESTDGMVRELSWRPTGWLASVTDHLPGGDTRHTETHVDATGLLAQVDGTDFHWDTTGFAPVPVQAGDTQVLSAGPVTGIGDSWTRPGWRTHRATGADPWSATRAGGASAVTSGLPETVSIGTDGGLSVAGMEWLGARVYDPASRGFLSVDPLDPVTGAGWSGNPYSYAGNDPLHALDPRGLNPLTDEDLRAYNAANNTGLAAAGDWVADNWEYLAGGAMVIAGGALMFAPIPGAQILGGGLISAGADTIIQKATTGEVNWGQVAVNGAAGMVGGGLGSMAMRGGMTTGRAMLMSGMVEGGLSGGGSYMMGPGPHTPAGLLTNTAVGTGTGAIQLPGGTGDNIAGTATRNLDDVAPVPAPHSGQALYRVYGGDSAPGGASWSPVNPNSVPNYRDVAGLPSGGESGATNSGRFVIEGTLQDPSAVVLTREALPLDGTSGGIPEYIVPGWQDSGAITVDRVSGVNPEF